MRSSGSKRWGRLAVIMLLVLAALVIAAPVALADNPGVIQGTLTQSAWSPNPGAAVANLHVYLYTDPDDDPIQETTSNSLGYYKFASVPGDDDYYIQYRETAPDVSDHLRDGAWVPMWWNAKSRYHAGFTVPDALTVAWNTTYTCDMVIQYRDEIRGTVTDAVTTLPVEGVGVYVYDTATDEGYADEDAWLRDIWSGDVQPDDVTDAAGVYAVTGILPTEGDNAAGRYKVFFFPPDMPNALLAPEWYSNVDFNDYAAAAQLVAPWASPVAPIDAALDPPGVGAIWGAVDQLNGWTGDREDAVGVTVNLYDNNNVWVDDTLTGFGGQYSFVGVIPGFYKVEFEGPENVDGNFWADYYDSWYTSPVEPGVPIQADNFYDAAWVQVDPGADTHNIWGLLYPIANIYRFVHPPYGVNDGPDRFETTVEFMGWGLHSVDWVSMIQQPPGAFRITRLDWGVNDDGTGWITLNLAQPKAPVGAYDLMYESMTPPGWTITEEYPGFQVVSSWVPTVPATPPSPTQPTPTTPTTPTPPVVNPTPEPSTPAAPVAGPVSVTASKASVKKGALAKLRFQVDEDVLGGTADVKVVISNKAGKVVKQIKAKVTMNAAASISFRCKLAKGVYSYTVSASGATASSTLTVR